MTTTPQPFDPDYDYEADWAIEDRLDHCRYTVPLGVKVEDLMSDASAEIRALRNLIKHMERRINSLIAECDELRGEE